MARPPVRPVRGHTIRTRPGCHRPSQRRRPLVLSPGSGSAERGESPADFTPERCIELIRTGDGDPDLDVAAADAHAVHHGRRGGDRASAPGNGFLVGDAAHRMTPAGALGMNTAIQSAHNLGWKLAWVARGWAGDALLDSYHAERQARR